MSDLLRDIGLDVEIEEETGTSSEEEASEAEQQTPGPSLENDGLPLDDDDGVSDGSQASAHRGASDQHKNVPENENVNQQGAVSAMEPSVQTSGETRQDTNVQQGLCAQANPLQQSQPQPQPGSSSNAQASSSQRSSAYLNTMSVRVRNVLAQRLREEEAKKAKTRCTPANSVEEQPANSRLGDGSAANEAHAHVQNPPETEIVQGRTPENPQINDEGNTYPQNTPREGNGHVQDSPQGGPEQLISPLRLNTPSPQMPSTPDREELLHGVVQTNEDTELTPPTRQTRPSLEDLQTPVISIYSTSPRFTGRQRDDDDDDDDDGQREEGNPETNGGTCRHQEPLKREDRDDEDGPSDHLKHSTPRPSGSVIGIARKLSPSTEEEQPRKRRPGSGAEREKRAASEDLGEPEIGGARPISSEGAADASVTADKQVQVLTPSKSPDRPREYTSPPGRAPVSRLELPDNFQVPDDTSPLGSGRRYQRTNMPSEYVPPQFNEASDSEEDSSSDEEDSLTDDSEAEEEVIVSTGNTPADSAAHSGSRREAQARGEPESEAPASDRQQRTLTRRQALIPTRQNPIRLSIRQSRVGPTGEREEDGISSPDIEAWIEAPKVPRRRTYGHQEVIRAESVLIYRVSSNSPRRRAPPQVHGGRMPSWFGRRNVLELTRGSIIPGGVMPSNGATAPRPRGLLNVGRYPGITERLNTSAQTAPAQRIPGGRNQAPPERMHWIRNQIAQAMHVNRNPVLMQQMHVTGNPVASAVTHANRDPSLTRNMNMTGNPVASAITHVDRDPIPSQQALMPGPSVAPPLMNANRFPIPSRRRHEDGNPVAQAVMHANRNMLPPIQHIPLTGNSVAPPVMHPNRNPIPPHHMHVTGTPVAHPVMPMNRNAIPSPHMHATGNPVAPPVMNLNRNPAPSDHANMTGNPVAPAVMWANRNQIPSHIQMTGHPAAPAVMPTNRNPIPSQHTHITGNPVGPAGVRVTRNPVTHEVIHMRLSAGSSQYMPESRSPGPSGMNTTRNPGTNEHANTSTNPSATTGVPTNRNFIPRDRFNRN